MKSQYPNKGLIKVIYRYLANGSSIYALIFHNILVRWLTFCINLLVRASKVKCLYISMPRYSIVSALSMLLFQLPLMSNEQFLNGDCFPVSSITLVLSMFKDKCVYLPLSARCYAAYSGLHLADFGFFHNFSISYSVVQFIF